MLPLAGLWTLQTETQFRNHLDRKSRKPEAELGDRSSPTCAKETGLKVNPFFATDYAGVIEALRFDKVQIAWYGNKSAMEAVDRAEARSSPRLSMSRAIPAIDAAAGQCRRTAG